MMEKREQYIAKFKAQLDKTDARIREFEAKMDGYSAEARKRYNETIIDLKDRRASLRKHLDELQKSSQENYARIKDEAEKSWNQLLGRVDEMAKKLKTK